MSATPNDLALVALIPAVAGLGLLGWRATRAAGSVGWRTPPGVHSSTDAAQDSRMWALERIVAGHLESREPNGLLAAELLGLARRRLALRHGVGLDTDRERAEALLGPDILTLLEAQPPRRLSLDRIDEVLRRVEAL